MFVLIIKLREEKYSTFLADIYYNINNSKFDITSLLIIRSYILFCCLSIRCIPFTYL